MTERATDTQRDSDAPSVVRSLPTAQFFMFYPARCVSFADTLLLYKKKLTV